MWLHWETVPQGKRAANMKAKCTAGRTGDDMDEEKQGE